MSINREVSIQPAWCRALPLQQQSVLLLATRGPDGFPKHHPCKAVHVAYRACVLLAAKYGRELHWGEKADGFMSLDVFSDSELWKSIVDDFFRHSDALPHHYLTHLMHGAQVLGYKHPNSEYRSRWYAFYIRVVESMHLQPESETAMDARLGDWNREGWDVPEVSVVKAGGDPVEGEMFGQFRERTGLPGCGTAAATELVWRGGRWAYEPTRNT